MKKLFLSVFTLTLLFVCSIAIAQEADPAKAAKAAKKALSSYNLDPANNGAKLEEALKNIQIATASPTAEVETYLTAGNIYNDLANKDDVMRSLNSATKSKYPDAPLNAYKSFKKVIELSTKKWEKTDANKGLLDNLNRLRNAGADGYAEKNYKGAYESFSAVVDANGILKAAGEKNVLLDKDINTYAYYAALCAMQGGMNAEAEKAYASILGKGTDEESDAYSGMYTVLSAQGKTAESLKILEEGVKKYPNNTTLLFTQINYYLKENKLEELITKLKVALEKEPNNVGLYSTLGNVYDNLGQTEAKAGNAAKSKEYLDASMKYYQDALVKEPNNFDANYSLGAYYYNKAAGYAAEINKLQDDYSDAGTKKYDAMKKEMNDVFNQGLPYFKKAENINPNDKNTLIALREILFRLNMSADADAIKNRLETLDAGKKNEAAYFKN